MTDASPIRLAVRLERTSSVGAQAGCSVILAILFGSISAAMTFYGLRNADDAGESPWILYAIAGFLGLLALLLLYAGIHQFFSLKTPETIVEMSERSLTRGRETRFFFRQPGPASLESLRANLVGEETWSVQRGTGQNMRSSSESRYLGTFNFFDSGPQEIDANIPYDALVAFLVPSDIPPSGRTDEGHMVSWKIEVWGKVRHRADFQHPYAIEVQ